MEGVDERDKEIALRLALDRMEELVPWGLYGASDGSLPGRGGSDAAP